MKKLSIRLHEKEHEKLKEIAISNGHLSMNSAISLVIAQHGFQGVNGKTKKQVQETKDTEKTTNCPICFQPLQISNGILVCEPCGIEVSNLP